ncbi:hypothetical protein KIPB_000869 [Kipferlia bialata]|uniref:Uncharacterized protein n=1 Tax=Kipferlia bialata TaxID=797122 RepID=A0A9K3CPV4_9EUKA|nr:hypothetical protein KIPB_000869 [Kipferlia bialata]|eukprot:g869.t1
MTGKVVAKNGKRASVVGTLQDTVAVAHAHGGFFAPGLGALAYGPNRLWDLTQSQQNFIRDHVNETKATILRYAERHPFKRVVAELEDRAERTGLIPRGTFRYIRKRHAALGARDINLEEATEDEIMTHQFNVYYPLRDLIRQALPYIAHLGDDC